MEAIGFNRIRLGFFSIGNDRDKAFDHMSDVRCLRIHKVQFSFTSLRFFVIS